jgi:hypothetical protein
MKSPRIAVPCISLVFLCCISAAHSATKPKIVTFGRWMPVKYYAGPEETTALELKVRPLLVNGEIKEYIMGEPHEVSERVFVVRQASRLNDALPDEPKGTARWRWHPGGWLMVDRANAHISKLTLPNYDSFYSSASWYRDLVAYCGISDNGTRLYAMVAQIGRRKAVLQKALGAPAGGDLPDSECGEPQWQRQPTRVTFAPKDKDKVSFSIRSFAEEIPVDNSEDDPGGE